MSWLDADTLIAVGVAVGLILVFGLGAIGGRRSRHPVPEERLRAVESRLGEVEHQLDITQVDVRKTKHDVANMRQTMVGLATVKDVNKVELRVAEMSGEVKGLGTSIHSLHASVDRMERFLMDATAKAIVAGRVGGGENG